MRTPVLMGVWRPLVLGKLVFSRSADQRQHDPYTLGGGAGFLFCTPAQVSVLLGLRQEFAVSLLAHLQGSDTIETAVHKLCWRQGAALSEPVDDGPDTR